MPLGSFDRDQLGDPGALCPITGDALDDFSRQFDAAEDDVGSDRPLHGYQRLHRVEAARAIVAGREMRIITIGAEHAPDTEGNLLPAETSSEGVETRLTDIGPATARS